jgi:hypothetical protein
VQFGTMAVILAVSAVLTAVHTSALNDPANRLRPIFGSSAAPAPTWDDARIPASYPQAGPGYPHWG